MCAHAGGPQSFLSKPWIESSSPSVSMLKVKTVTEQLSFVGSICMESLIIVILQGS